MTRGIFFISERDVKEDWVKYYIGLLDPHRTDGLAGVSGVTIGQSNIYIEEMSHSGRTLYFAATAEDELLGPRIIALINAKYSDPIIISIETSNFKLFDVLVTLVDEKLDVLVDNDYGGILSIKAAKNYIKGGVDSLTLKAIEVE